MAKFMGKTVLGATLAATALTAAAPADAQRWRRYHRDRGGDVATGAIIGGLVGLGVGAAIASNNRRDRYYDPYFDRRYNYYPQYNYYDPYFQPRRNFYRPYRGFGNRCYTVRDRDPWTGRRVRYRVCD